MNAIVKPFDSYRLQYATTNPQGRDLTRIEFFCGGTTVGQLLSGAAIGPGSYVSLRGGQIFLYFDSARLANALAILQGEPDLALYFVPDRENSEREQGSEGGICTSVVKFGGAAPVATAQAGLKATVEFDTPTPQDGSFNYRVTKTTGGLDSLAELDGQPSVVGNRTTLAVKGLTAGTKYTFKVTATSSTTGAFATSLSSNEITAIA
jgi:hypothetical protein